MRETRMRGGEGKGWRRMGEGGEEGKRKEKRGGGGEGG